jgi:hypothetical protein
MKPESVNPFGTIGGAAPGKPGPAAEHREAATNSPDYWCAEPCFDIRNVGDFGSVSLEDIILPNDGRRDLKVDLLDEVVHRTGGIRLEKFF